FQLKAVIVDEKLRVRHSAAIQFDTVLPEFRTHNGVIRGPDKHTVTAPTLMWVKALDILLDQLRVEGADFGKLVALSGTGQQHGTVYWNRGARSVLRSLDPAHFLHSQLASCFSISHSPVWMDASTTQQCRQLEAAVGGPENLAKITGSIGYERFSGAQISKIAQTKPGAYENTEACAPDLGSKLGDPVPCTTELGPVHEYYVERFGFNPECRVAVFTGDNPSSMAGNPPDELPPPSEVNQQTNPFSDNQNTTPSGDFSNTNPFLSSNQNTSPTKDLLSVQENQNSSPTKDSVDGQDNQSTTPSKDPLNGRENTSAESLDESPLQENSTDQQAKDTNQETDETSQHTSQPKDAISEVIGSNTELEVVDPKAGAVKENEDGFGLPSFFESTACAPPAKLLCSPYPDAGK
ncbi:xylulose kinase-like, partial [Diaphorina citri]|uniref:Xylulose kinase-like n=1 Tax=Diaphorina citri TaxID=121845 RepID=A0A1S3DNH3_DIACI